MNLAARLTSRAGDDEILVAGAVHDALAERLDAEGLDDLEVKGFDQRVRAWRLIGIRTGESVRLTPFVGRRGELAHFGHALESCRDLGRGMSIYLRGEAGIGSPVCSTRCAGSRPRKGSRATRAPCSTSAPAPNATRCAAWHAASLRTTRRPKEPNASSATTFSAILSAPELHAVAEAMDHTTRHKGRMAALAALVADASADRPLLLAVEDVHWADETTLDYLACLCEKVAECRALLVMTSRIENDPLGAAWRARANGASLLTIDLGPLRDEDATTLAGALLDLSTPIARRCIARANGHPLFLEQLLRHAADPGDAEIPATVQSVVLARADKLAPEDRRALQVAAVLGQHFTLAALRHVLEDEAYSAEALIEHLLLSPDGPELVFHHALIRDGVYSSLLSASARTFHLAAASWYRERDLVVHAEHLDRGADSTAPAAYAAAARAEMLAYRPRAALALVRRGQGCATSRADGHELARLEAEVLLDLAEVPGSIEASGRALGLADTNRQRCTARLALAAGLRMVDSLDAAFAALQEAEREAMAEGLTEAVARIHHLRGNLYFPRGRIADCRSEHELAVLWAEKAGTPELKARALSGLGDVDYICGRYRSARDHFGACIALCREHALGKIEVANRGMLAITRWFCGESALEEADEGIEAAGRVGHLRGELIAQHGRLMALIGLLRLDEARAGVARARALAQQLGALRFEAENLWFLATIERLSGDSAAAAALLREALALSRATSIGFFGGAILGSLALTTNDAAERAAALAEAEPLLDTGSVSHNHFFFARDAIDAALAEDDPERALGYAARLRAYTAAEPLPWSDLVIERAESLVAAARAPASCANDATLARLTATARRLGQLDLIAALDAAQGERRYAK